MQSSNSSGEKNIDQIYHCQITPRGYDLNVQTNSIKYTFNQRMLINTVNLTQFQFYNCFPNINKYYNIISVVINNQYYSIQLPESVYSFWDIFDLLTIYANQFNAQIPAALGCGVWSFILVGNNNRFVRVTNTGGVKFRFDYDSASPNQNQLLQYIGFGEDDNAFVQPLATQTAIFPYNVQVSNSIYLTCRDLNINSEVNFCLAVIPINEPILQLIQYSSPFYQCNRHIVSRGVPVGLQYINISFLDDLGYPLVVENNRITLVLMCERYVE